MTAPLKGQLWGPTVFGPDEVLQPGTPIQTMYPTTVTPVSSPFIPKPSVLPTVLPKPPASNGGTVVPTIDVGGPVVNPGKPYILPEVVVTADKPVPWWVWALGAVALYMLFGRRRG